MLRLVLAIQLCALVVVSAAFGSSVKVGEKTVRVSWTPARSASYVVYLAAVPGCDERTRPVTVRAVKGKPVSVLLRASPRLCVGVAYVGVDVGRRNVVTKRIVVRRR